MTTTEEARSWFQRANACFQVLQESEQRLMECEVRVEEAEMIGSKRLAERWRSEAEFAQLQHKAAFDHLLALTGAVDRGGAVNRLVDMAVRFEELNDKHEQWRRMLATQQFVHQTEVDQGGDESGAREEAEDMVNLAYSMYERCQRLVIMSVPKHA